MKVNSRKMKRRYIIPGRSESQPSIPKTFAFLNL